MKKIAEKVRPVLTPSDVDALGAGVRTKPVRCGKKACKTCPHFIYVYKRIYSKGRTIEKYLGKYKAGINDDRIAPWLR